MATNLMFIIGLLVDLTSVIEGVLVYACYKPPGSACTNHNLTCSNGDLIRIFHLYYATKPSNITCPLIQDEDDCKTSVCCTRGSGDTKVTFNQQDRLTVYKKCSYKESCSLNYPYSSTTGYDYIWYHYGCFWGYSDNYIINTTTFTTKDSRYLIFSGKSTPTRDLTCSCNITGRFHFAIKYIFLSAGSCNSVTIIVDNQSLYRCTGDDVVLLPSNIKYDKISIQFNRYTSNTNDVIWVYYYHTASQYLRVSGDCSNPVLVDGGWSAWSNTPCSATCGQGTRKRYRYCNSPTPANNGKNCIGDIMDSEPCTGQSCSALYETIRVNGGWSAWSNTSCSVTCGVGIRTRFRHCDNPHPANGGTDCNGELSENIDCNLEECPGTSVNKLPWILFAVCFLVVIVGIIWVIVRLVRRRREKKSPNLVSDPKNTNNASSTSDAVYYVNAATINSLNQSENNESQYDTLSARVKGEEANYTSLT